MIIMNTARTCTCCPTQEHSTSIVLYKYTCCSCHVGKERVDILRAAVNWDIRRWVVFYPGAIIMRVILASRKHGSALNTRSMILYVGISKGWRHVSASGVAVRGDSSVAGEGVPKFHSWGKRTMPLTNINSDWMSNASSGLCITLHYITFNSHLGVQ